MGTCAASDYRARYYDPSAGRFLREDPARFRGGTNWYEYVENSPANIVDPSGRIIAVAPGSGQEGMRDFITALLYLENSPYANAIIQDLQNSPEVYLIHISDQYDHDGRSGPYVKWNPHLGGCTNSGNDPQSPALLLGHELGHLWEAQNGLDSSDEEAATKISNRIAAELGEAARKNYGDARYIRQRPWPLPIPSRPMKPGDCGCK